MLKEFTEILSYYMGIDVEEIRPETPILSRCDEMEFAEMVLVIEEEFDISIPDEALNEWTTVSDLWGYIKEARVS